MKKIMALALGFALVAGTSMVWADQTNYDIGKVAAAELKIGLGPRAVAMGEAFVAKADDLNALAWNPAGLAQLENLQAGFMHSAYLSDTSLEYAAVAGKLMPGSGFGANVMYLNYGSIPKTGESGGLPTDLGSFTPSTMVITAGYGQWLIPMLAVGGAVKYYTSNIDGTALSAFAVDLGTLAKISPELNLGLALQNLGSSINGASLPMNAKAGMAYVLPIKISTNDVWNALADLNLPFGDTKYMSANLGTEYWFNQMIAARLGYKLKDAGDLSGAVGLTAGAGVQLPIGETLALGLDYALLSYGDLGLTHQIEITASFK